MLNFVVVLLIFHAFAPFPHYKYLLFLVLFDDFSFCKYSHSCLNAEKTKSVQL